MSRYSGRPLSSIPFILMGAGSTSSTTAASAALLQPRRATPTPAACCTCAHRKLGFPLQTQWGAHVGTGGWCMPKAHASLVVDTRS